MNAVLVFDRIHERHRHLVGGKALALATHRRSGILVPDGLCITTVAYRSFINTTGLSARIGLELGRLPLAQMRWEEIWDMALRIRSLFLNTEIPEELKAGLVSVLAPRFGDAAAAVRSSSPQEDREGTSFAGLHDSYVNVRGIPALLDHIRLVWASLWSDGALLYRKELGMDMQNSAMAVIVQELVSGERSGVAFSRSPDGADHAVVESVYGLNQGLVDGTIAPDRWTIHRSSGQVLSHTPANRESAIRSAAAGTRQQMLSREEQHTPPLNDNHLGQVFRMAMTLEKRDGRPQDVEWTFRGDQLFLLQCRPVTTTETDDHAATPWSADDKRPWYQSLKRSFDNLRALHHRIEAELLPRMAAEAKQLASIELTDLSDPALVEAIDARVRSHQRWRDVYWRDFIPFAHGARLFGQVYNDLLKPDDPYAFTALLGETEMTGLSRNRDLQELAGMIRSDPHLRQQLQSGPDDDLDADFADCLERFLNRYEDLTFKAVRFFKDRAGLVRLLLEMAARPEATQTVKRPDISALCADFIDRFPEERRDFAREILEIGRASYRLRDNDNIVLARIEAQLIKAVEEGKRRIAGRRRIDLNRATPHQVARLLADPEAVVTVDTEPAAIDEPVQQQGRPELVPTGGGPLSDGAFVMRARQIIGQPAGRGLAMGPARVVASVDDLFRFKSGEILVCDAIDPNMTFVVPLAAAIVERRGGMLVHGAIIAREYGLPCVTGVADATALIHTGDRLTVDGYLGIVTLDA